LKVNPAGKNKLTNQRNKTYRAKITVINLQKKLPVGGSLSSLIKRAVQNTISSESTKKDSETTICLVTDRKIKAFNKKYLFEDHPTDVIAFNTASGTGDIGIIADVLVSTDTAVTNARVFKTSPLHELLLYVIHGILHVLGYDDQNAKDSKIMQAKADRILGTLSIK